MTVQHVGLSFKCGIDHTMDDFPVCIASYSVIGLAIGIWSVRVLAWTTSRVGQILEYDDSSWCSQ